MPHPYAPNWQCSPTRDQTYCLQPRRYYECRRKSLQNSTDEWPYSPRVGHDPTWEQPCRLRRQHVYGQNRVRYPQWGRSNPVRWSIHDCRGVDSLHRVRLLPVAFVRPRRTKGGHVSNRQPWCMRRRHLQGDRFAPPDRQKVQCEVPRWC